MLWTLVILVLILTQPALASSIAPSEERGMLERFRPAIYFENDGPSGHRVDYPISHVADDSDIENNFAMPALAPGVVCYGQVHEQRDAGGKICWVVEYHFYYPRNWTHFSLGFRWEGYSHEHDWEWLYIVVGSSQGQVMPYCASFSAHASNNQSLFSDKGAVRLFPNIIGGSVWRSDWAERPEEAPRVSLDAAGHVEATALASGNEFDGSPEQGRYGFPVSEYPIIAVEGAQSSCADPNLYYYGDPGLPSGCPICDGWADCVSPREPPWIRFGLGGQSPLPLSFRLPDDWDENASTEILSARASRVIGPTPARDWCQIVFDTGHRPEDLTLLDVAGRRIGSLPAPGSDGVSVVDLRGLPSGIYLVRMRFPGCVEEVQRVVVFR